MRICLFILFTLLCVTPLTSPVDVNAYNNGMLIEDSLFDFVDSMTEQEIRDFINSRPSSCLATSGAIFPEPIDYFTYGGNVDAARVIYKAAHYSDVNPQVILTTLQKEQSLITRTNCYENSGIDSRNKAMGMGCPDGGQCPAPAYAGFHQQVMKGTWQLGFNRQRAVGNISWGGNDNITYYGYMTRGNFKRCASCSTIFYDGYGTIDGQSVYLENGPTASLYSYTPHLGQSFPSIYESWFGSTTPGNPTFAHPDGTLVRQNGTPTVYIVEGNQKRSVTSEAVMISFGYNFNQVKLATSGDVQLPMANEGMKFREGTLVRGSSPTVYSVDSSNGTLYKRSLGTLEIFQSLGYNFSEVINVSDSELPSATASTLTNADKHPDGTLIKSQNSPTVYFIENGTRRSMTSLPVFISHGLSFNKVKTATSDDMQLPEGAPIGFREGTLIKGSAPTVYVLDYITGNLYKRSLGSYYNFIGLGYKFWEVITVSPSEMPINDGSPVGQ